MRTFSPARLVTAAICVALFSGCLVGSCGGEAEQQPGLGNGGSTAGGGGVDGSSGKGGTAGTGGIAAGGSAGAGGVAATGGAGGAGGSAGTTDAGGASGTAGGAGTSGSAGASGAAGADAGIDEPDATPDGPEAGDSSSEFFWEASISCSPSELADRWNVMSSAPIVPLVGAAGLDLRGPSKAGLTLAQAELVNCQSSLLGDFWGDGTMVSAWGEYEQVWVLYDPSDTVIHSVEVWSGYVGKLSFHSKDGAHSYVVKTNDPLTKDGELYQLDWDDATKFAAEVDELFRALMNTYAPSVALPAQNCVTAPPYDCASGDLGDGQGYIGFSSLGLVVWFPNIADPQPAASKPDRLSIYVP